MTPLHSGLSNRVRFCLKKKKAWNLRKKREPVEHSHFPPSAGTLSIHLDLLSHWTTKACPSCVIFSSESHYNFPNQASFKILSTVFSSIAHSLFSMYPELVRERHKEPQCAPTTAEYCRHVSLSEQDTVFLGCSDLYRSTRPGSF